VAYNPSTHSIYGVQLAPGKGRIPRGQPGQAAPETPSTDGRIGAETQPPGRPDREKSRRAGENDKTGSNGEEGKASIRIQLEELARQASSRVFNNPNGKNYQLGSMSLTPRVRPGRLRPESPPGGGAGMESPSVTMELNIHGCTLASFVIERNGTVSE